MRLSLPYISAFILFSASARAQDVPLTQFQSAPLYLNPGSTGVMADPYDMRFSVNYRQQSVTGLDQPGVTGIISFDVATMQDKLPEGDAFGIGFIGYYDRSVTGGVTGTTAGFSFAYNHAVDRNHFHHVSLGVQGMVVQKHLDLSRLTSSEFYGNDATGPLIPSPASTDNTDLSYTDANAGVVYTGEITPRLKAEAGYAYYHLAKPQEVLMGISHNVDNRQTEHASASYLLSRKLTVSVSGLLQSQGSKTNGLAGGFVSWKLDKSQELDVRNMRTRILSAGCWYRFNEAICPFIGFEAQNFHFGFSYDIGTSLDAAGKPLQNAFEVSVNYVRRHRRESDKERENNYFRGNRSIY